MSHPCPNPIINFLKESEYGDLSKQCPVSSSILRNALLGTVVSSNPLFWKQIDNAISKNSNENKKLTIDCDINNYPILNISDFNKYRCTDPKEWRTHSKNIQLAQELLLASSEAVKTARASWNKHNASRKASEVSPATSSNEEDLEHNNVSKSRRTTFLSAKEQYKQEGGTISNKSKPEINSLADSKDSKLPAELAHCDKALVDRIEADILHRGQPVTFEDIAGLHFAKECVVELICWPMNQPQLFQGLRALPRGMLFFGPPGTGKTLIGKAIAHQSGATFFSISASSLMSKWIGEGEKTVRTLFEVAYYRQPSVVFIDEVDSLLSQRSSDENEATRRIKTEFMVQLDGANTKADSRVVIIGATNRPEELDEAVRRRFVKRIYIPLPDSDSRLALFRTLLKTVHNCINEVELFELVRHSKGYSGADIKSLCTEAAMGPIREIAATKRGNIMHVDPQDLPPVSLRHFQHAFENVLSSVSPTDLERYIEWNNLYGSFRKYDESD